MKELLKKLAACKEGIVWASDKTWEEIYTTCYRGDWLLWLFAKTTDLTVESNHRLFALAKGKCANTVRHLMIDERSINAVDTTIAYGEGKATRAELEASYAAATSAAYSSADYAAFTAVSSYGASAAYAAATYATYAAADYAATGSTSASVRKANQLETANIVKSTIPIKIWNINN